MSSLPNTYTDNTSRLVQPSTVGFKISKPGYDARYTSGNNYVFNSDWPSLPIAFEITIDNPITSSSSTATIPHNLGFAPFTMGWYYHNDASGKNNSSSRFALMADQHNVYLNGNQEYCPPFNATKLKIRCFTLDLSRDIDYNLAPGDTFNMPYDNSYGIKVVKNGKDIHSKDMRDFSIHSRCQSPLILAVKTEATVPPANILTGQNAIQYTTKLNYPVWVYGFIKMGSGFANQYGVPENTYFPAPMYAQAYPRLFTDGFTSYITYSTADPNNDNGATLVVLRDPMFSPNQVTVHY
jgi:hypothetical protein